MRTTQQRIDQYNAKVVPGRYETLMTAIIPLAKGNFAASANAYESDEASFLLVLESQAVPRTTYGGYLACWNKCRMMKATGGGVSWQIACLVLLYQWVSRGLTQSVLEEGLMTVLGWSHPSSF